MIIEIELLSGGMIIVVIQQCTSLKGGHGDGGELGGICTRNSSIFIDFLETLDVDDDDSSISSINDIKNKDFLMMMQLFETS